MSTMEQPKPSFPKQHQEKPGIESELDPRPRYQAPRYRGSGKLEGEVALITGGDSGIGRAVLCARKGADVANVYLPRAAGCRGDAPRGRGRGAARAAHPRRCDRAGLLPRGSGADRARMRPPRYSGFWSTTPPSSSTSPGWKR